MFRAHKVKLGTLVTPGTLVALVILGILETLITVNTSNTGNTGNRLLASCVVLLRKIERVTCLDLSETCACGRCFLLERLGALQKSEQAAICSIRE